MVVKENYVFNEVVSVADLNTISATTNDITDNGLPQRLTSNKTIQFNQELDNGSKTTDFDVTWEDAQKQKATLTANTITLTLVNPTSVGNFLLKLVNGGLATLTWAATTGTVLWSGGTPPTLSSSGTDILSFYYDGTNFYGVPTLDFS